MQKITQEYLKSILYYNSDTGIFTWRKARQRITIDSIAGNIRKDGYIKIVINRKFYQAHRLAWLYMYGYMPPEQIDHINHIRTDNRICNLRAVSRQENGKNQSKPITNKSGHSGVCWHKKINKWNVQIGINKKQIYLGMFDNINDAIAARKQAEIYYGFHENHGE